MQPQYPEIGVVDTRNLIYAIIDSYGIDLKNYAMTHLMHRIQVFMFKNSFPDAERLQAALTENQALMNEFIAFLSVPETEMFRDPAVWRYLRNHFLPERLRNTRDPYKIWLPDTVSGDELYTLLILLEENKLFSKVRVHASVSSDINRKKIFTEEVDSKLFDTSKQNYGRFKGTCLFESYFDMKDSGYFRKQELLSKVEFFHQDRDYNKGEKNCDLIIFRNKTIYVTSAHKEATLSKLDGYLATGGHMIIGILERLSENNSNTRYSFDNERESIYKKR